jgi:hypothetical protein
MLRIFKNKSFTRFAKKSDISDTALCKAVRDAEQGLIDADLGGGVIKQRVARAGQGKSGGYRTMILFKAGTRAFFVHGFAKNEKDNIEPEDLIAFRKLAARMLEYKDTELTQALNKHLLTEVICDDEKLP